MHFYLSLCSKPKAFGLSTWIGADESPWWLLLSIILVISCLIGIFPSIAISRKNKTISHLDFQTNIMITFFVLCSFDSFQCPPYIQKIFCHIFWYCKHSSYEHSKPLIDYNWWWGMECVALVWALFIYVITLLEEN